MSLFDLIKTAVMVETMKAMVTAIVKAIVTAMVKGMNEPYSCERELKDHTNVIYNIYPVIPYIYVTLRSIRDQLLSLSNCLYNFYSNTLSSALHIEQERKK
jgi:hypothetical protein